MFWSFSNCRISNINGFNLNYTISRSMVKVNIVLRKEGNGNRQTTKTTCQRYMEATIFDLLHIVFNPCLRTAIGVANINETTM